MAPAPAAVAAGGDDSEALRSDVASPEVAAVVAVVAWGQKGAVGRPRAAVGFRLNPLKSLSMVRGRAGLTSDRFVTERYRCSSSVSSQKS